MLVGENGQKRILSYGNSYQNLIDYYNVIIKCSNDLQTYGNFSHGMSTLRYYLKYNNTIFYLKCDNEELKTKAHNMAIIGHLLYMGTYQKTERNKILKEIITDCEDMKQIINKLSQGLGW